MKTIIIEMTAKQKMAWDSLMATHGRREEALKSAEAANDVMVKTWTETGDLNDLGVADRFEAEDRIRHAEEEAKNAWARYKKATDRYYWEYGQCRALGIVE